MDTVTDLLGKAGYLPHGYCISWNPGLLWTMVFADLAIALSYYSIPAALLTIVKKRRDFGFNWVVVLFSLFILACGTTHVLDVWTLWYPDYGVLAVSKVITAVVSVATALSLWPLIPKALAIPSVRALQQSVASYEKEAAHRALAETYLRRTRGGLRVALARMGAAFIATDPTGLVVEMNETAQQLTGWTEKDAIGVYVRRVLRRHGGQAPTEGEDLLRFLADNDYPVDTITTLDILRKDGGVQPLSLTVSVIRDEADLSVLGTVVIFADRTEALRAQAETMRLTALVESSSDAIVGTTTDGIVNAWNKGAVRMFGVSADAALGQEYESLVPPRVPALAVGAQSQPQADGTHAFERQHIGGASLMVLSELASFVENGQGNVVGVSHILRDVTVTRRAEDLRVAEIELRAENLRMSEAAQLKNQFLANMSHELRTPLNSIIGFSQLLAIKDHPITEQQASDFLGYIRSSGEHLLRLINDVLDLSKVESGTFEYFPEPIKLQLLAADAVMVLKPQAAAQAIKVAVDVDSTLTDVEADPARLKQIVFNYLSNAIKFSKKGGQVFVRFKAEGDDAFRVEVEDAGIGISEEGLQRLFVEFQQLDTGLTKNHQGTGLGLALTRKLVAAQGGTTGVRSTIGKGSVFHAVLPRKGRQISLGDAPIQETPRLNDQMPRLLVVDDDQGTRQLVANHGIEAGFLVTSRGEADGMAQARAHAFDAISMNILVRETLGPQLLAAVRAQITDDPVTLIIVPTHPPVAFRVHDIISKPTNEAHLETALERLGVLNVPKARLLVVDDDPKALTTMAISLRRLRVEADFLDSATAAFEFLRERTPQALILDLMMPNVDGFMLLDLLRSSTALQSVPVLVWTGRTLSAAERRRLMDRGPVNDIGREVDTLNLQSVLLEAATLIARRKVGTV